MYPNRITRPSVRTAAYPLGSLTTRFGFICFSVVLLLLLTGCGAGRDTRSPEEIHTTWIAVLRANDRQAAQALLADDATVAVDWALEQAQYLMTIDSAIAGRLQTVDVEVPVAQGAGHVGRSIWRMERLTSCFHTTIAETPAGWRVTGFVERQTDCPR